MATWRAVVTISHAALGGTGTNTWHLRTTGLEQEPFTGLNTMMGWLESFYTEVGAVAPGGTVFSFDGVISGVGTDEGEQREVDTWTVDGINSSGILPPANAIVVNWLGDEGDRSRRGRTFLGPIGVNQVASDGTPSAECLTTLRGAAAQLVTVSAAFNDGAMGIWSRQESVLRDFVSSGISNQFAVLTSRRD